MHTKHMQLCKSDLGIIIPYQLEVTVILTARPFH